MGVSRIAIIALAALGPLSSHAGAASKSVVADFSKWLASVQGSRYFSQLSGTAPAAPAPDKADPANPFTLGYTEHLGKLFDTVQNPIVPLGFGGVDGGETFPLGNKLMMLTGDLGIYDYGGTCTGGAKGPNCPDYFYDAPAVNGQLGLPTDGSLPRFHYYPPVSNSYFPPGLGFLPFYFPNPTQPGHGLGCMNGPVEGFTYGGKTYVFFISGWANCQQDNPSLTIGETQGQDFADLQVALDSKGNEAIFATQYFNQLSVVLDDQGTLWIYGSGKYRHSPMYLAQANVNTFLDHDTWTYWNGSAFVAGESNAQPVFRDTNSSGHPIGCIGELSVRKHPALGTWLATYNCEGDILLRTASSPTGPWSAPLSLMPTWWGPAFGDYAHQSYNTPWGVTYDDGLSNFNWPQQGGAFYGPYMIPSYFKTDAPGVYSIYYTIQSWNPYILHLMHTVLTTNGATVSPPGPGGVGLPPAQLANPVFSDGTTQGWTTVNGGKIWPAPDGSGNAVTTYTSNFTGEIQVYQDFTIDSNTTWLSFRMTEGASAYPNPASGYNCSVQLVRLDTGDVVRQSWGAWYNQDPVNNEDLYLDPGVLPVYWRLDSLGGKSVRLLIDAKSPDCFIEAWSFALGGSEAGPPATSNEVGFYTFLGAHVGTYQNLCLDLYGDNLSSGNHFDSALCNGTGAQKYILTPVSGTPAFTISPAANSGMCLDVLYAGFYNGAPIDLAACNGTAAQQWALVSGTLRPYSAQSLCLNVEGANMTNGTVIDLETCSNLAPGEKFLMFRYPQYSIGQCITCGWGSGFHL